MSHSPTKPTMRSLWLDSHDPHRIRTAELPADPSFDVVVAGAGLTGLATALMLAHQGLQVAVLEARSVGAVATGNTTAKLSLLQGTVLSQIRSQHGPGVTRAYVEASRDGQSWLLDFCRAHDVPVQHRPATTYATTKSGLSSVHSELEAAQEAGLDARFEGGLELPFEVAGAAVLEDQAQFDPMDVLSALAAEFAQLGGTLVEGVRVTSVPRRGPFTLETTAGQVRAGKVVLATGVPFTERGGYSVRMQARRSYALTFEVGDGFRPHGMHISADDPVRTLRSVPHDGRELLLVGGNDHVTGRTSSTAQQVLDLERWTEQHVPGARRTHAWAAQDYHPAGHLPLIGPLPGSDSTAYVGTGYSKWGMTGAVAAALAISGLEAGQAPAWLEPLDGARPGVKSLGTGAARNASVGAHMASGWARGELRELPEVEPADGSGIVGRRGGRPVAQSTIDGVTCRVSGICTHLGGVLAWNDAEKSWDCPLHGSRFAPDGQILEGPATRPLAPDDDEPA